MARATWSGIGLFVIAAGSALYVARDLFLPIVLAFLIALTFSPVVRFGLRWHIPASLTALVLMLVLVMTGAGIIYGLSGPANDWAAKVPAIQAQLRTHWHELRAPFTNAIEASEELSELAGNPNSAGANAGVPQPPLIQSAATNVLAGMTTTAVTLILAFFLLSAGNLFYTKLVRVMPTMHDKKLALSAVHSVEQELSTYLATIALINVGLGVAVGCVAWSIGLPDPVLWGAMATMLNFIPYAGALVGSVVLAAVALITFGQLEVALLTGAAYLLLSAVEGNLLTPILVGRRMAMNAVVIFISVGVWTWLWGPIGAVIAVPLLVTLKVLCSHIESLQWIGEFLSDGRELQRDTAVAPVPQE